MNLVLHPFRIVELLYIGLALILCVCQSVFVFQPLCGNLITLKIIQRRDYFTIVVDTIIYQMTMRIVGVVMIGVDGGAFWSQMQAGVDVFSDIGNSVIKSVVFAIAVGLISLYQGYNARPTPEGVSRATTRTVVISSLMVLGLDFIMTALMFSV